MQTRGGSMKMSFHLSIRKIRQIEGWWLSCIEYEIMTLYFDGFFWEHFDDFVGTTGIWRIPPMEGVEVNNFPRFKGDPSAWMIFCMFLCSPFSRIFRCSQSNCAPASAMAVRSSFLFFSGGATLDISFVTYTKTSTTIHPASSNPTCTPPPPAAAGAKPGNFSAILLLGHVTF